VQGGPTGGQHRQLRTGRQQLAEVLGRRDHLLEVVQHEQQGPALEPVDEHGQHPAGAFRVDAVCLRDRSGPRRRVAHRGEVHERDPCRSGGRGGADEAGHLERQACLSDAARAGHRDQADVGVAEEREDFREVVLAADDPGGRHRRRRDPQFRRLRALRGAEPLAQQDGQVVTQQVGQLVGVLEALVGQSVVGLDVRQQRCQSRVALRRILDVDQLRQVSGQAVFVLEAG
jgi:hypothetical protein